MKNKLEERGLLPRREDLIKVVALYIRRSRGDIEEDLEKHKMEMIEKCEKEGWQYVIYEEVESGDSIEARPVLQQLMRDIEEGQYDAVMCFAYDRIARGGSGDQERIFNLFRNTATYYIALIPYKVYDMDDESDEQQADVQGFVAKIEFKLIKRRLREGKKAGLKMGNFVFSVAPYGYKYSREKKGLIIDEEKSKIVREMVDMFLNQNMTTYAIAQELNRRRIPSPKKKEWCQGTIDRMFANKTYTGCIVGNKSRGYSKAYIKKHPTARPHEKFPESYWKIVENCHEAIITKEEHEEIKRQTKSKPKKRFSNEIRKYTKLIKCGKCGSNIFHKNADMICSCKCGENRGGYIDIIDDAIYQTATAIKNRLENVEVDDSFVEREQLIRQKIDECEKKIKDEESAIERIEEAYENGKYSLEKCEKRTEKREKNIAMLQVEISKLQSQIRVKDDDERLEKISAIDKFINDIKNTEDDEKLNGVLHSFVKEIVWEKNQELTVASVTVRFH